MSLIQKIIDIQSELKAPKNQYNNFGKYKYRSCEDILEGVKPLLAKHSLLQTIRDELRIIGDRYYVEATVIVSDGESDPVYATALAREPENKKGMDESQITGTASSYARKYALNGMWLIDDTKDNDVPNEGEKRKPEIKPDTARWHKAVTAVAKGDKDIDFIKKNYIITDANAELLVSKAMQIKKANDKKESK